MKIARPFFEPLKPVRDTIASAVKTAGQKISKAVLLAGLAKRSSYKGFTMLEVGDETYAFIRTDNEADRYPLSGGFNLRDAEMFVLARERRDAW